VRIAPDVERLLAPLRVSWEGSVREPEPVALVGHVDDPTWSYDMYRTEVEGDNDDRPSYQGRVVRCESRPDMTMCLPQSKSILGALEGPVTVAELDQEDIVLVAAR
jgi:hypothetical protein